MIERVSNSEWSAFASDLGFGVGDWPTEILVTSHGIPPRYFNRLPHYGEYGYKYLANDNQTLLTVYND